MPREDITKIAARAVAVHARSAPSRSLEVSSRRKSRVTQRYSHHRPSRSQRHNKQLRHSQSRKPLPPQHLPRAQTVALLHPLVAASQLSLALTPMPSCRGSEPMLVKTAPTADREHGSPREMNMSLMHMFRWCQTPYKDDWMCFGGYTSASLQLSPDISMLLAPSVGTMLKEFGGNYEAAAKAFCGREAIVTDTKYDSRCCLRARR